MDLRIILLHCCAPLYVKWSFKEVEKKIVFSRFSGENGYSVTRYNMVSVKVLIERIGVTRFQMN